VETALLALPAAHAPNQLEDDEPKTAKVGAPASAVLIPAFIFGFLMLVFAEWPVTETRPDRTILHSRPIVEYRLPGGPRSEGPASLGMAGGGGDLSQRGRPHPRLETKPRRQYFPARERA